MSCVGPTVLDPLYRTMTCMRFSPSFQLVVDHRGPSPFIFLLFLPNHKQLFGQRKTTLFWERKMPYMRTANPRACSFAIVFFLIDPLTPLQTHPIFHHLQKNY